MNYKSIFASALCLLMSGCNTYTAINKDIPDKYIEVVQAGSSVDVEASLKSSGAAYTCKELFFGNNSAKNRRACYVKAPEENRFKTLGVKLQDVPEAMLTDAGEAVVVVGKVAINIYLQLVSQKMQ